MKFEFSASEITLIRESLNLRANQLRRAINLETDSDILRIRQAQFKAVDALIIQFSEVQK